MKKLIRFFTGGIQRKILFVFVLTMIVIVVTFSVVINRQIGRIQEISSDENKSQLNSIRQITSATTTDMIDTSLGNATRIEASLVDNVFKNLKRQLEQLVPINGRQPSS